MADEALPDNATEAQVNLAGESDGSEYYLEKNRFYRIKCSKVKDEVDNTYVINYSKPLPQFDTAFAKAYSVTKKHGGTGGDVYALLLDKKYPIRLAEINKLMGRRVEHLANIVAAQVIPVSTGKGRIFAVIVEQPSGIAIVEYIRKNGPINENYLARTLVPVLNDLISNLSKNSIVHGRININNIYIDDTGYITLGECISEPTGYSQPAIYEPINRAAAMPIGKGTGSKAVDYHALGVLIAILLRGRNPVEGLKEEEVLHKKFEEGTYKIVTDNMEISPRMLDLLRGVLDDRKLDVWDSEQIKEWIKGRRFNLLPPAEAGDAGRPIIFNNKKYSSRKYLVHDMYLNWDEGKKFIKQDAIIKWIDRSAQEADLAERLQIVSGRHSRDRETQGFDKDDEVLSQYIILLDPNGPIRLRDFSANIDGIGTSLVDGFSSNKRQNIEAVENIVAHNLTLSITENIRAGSASNPSAQEAAFNLQKCAELLRKPDFGFGIERCLYELNPTLSCQSPQLIDDISFTQEELLQAIDKNDSIGGKILDKHMAAFLSKRLELPTRVRIASLGSFPEFSSNIYLQVLALLSMAQQTSNAGQLPKLSNKMHESLKNVVNEFKSKSIRNELSENMQKVGKKGNLSFLLRIISDPKYLVRDKVGFKKAVSTYRSNAIQISRLGNSKAVNNVGYRYGLQLAVMISFFVATVEVITLMLRAF